MIGKKLLSLALALVLALSLTAPALAADTATVIRLTKTTGTVEISKSSGKPLSLLTNMRLYNGYHVSTDEESYAWINLDDSKLLKEDAESEVEVRKNGKNLEVQLSSGNVFFDVAEDLGDDESLNIRTSTMVVGIRGTSGWMEAVDGWNTRVSVLEGVVECSVADSVTGQIKTEEVRGGESALCVVYPREEAGEKCDIIRGKFTVDNIPGFVLTDLTRDMALCDKIENETGLDIPRDLAAVAGGDPSGRTPERDSATKEVLDEADRREDEDEADLRHRIKEVEKELEKQPGSVSSSKPLSKPAVPAPSESDSDDRDSGGSTTPAPAPEPDPEPTPPEPPSTTTYQVTFDACGGLVNGANTSVQKTSETEIGKLDPWPEDPVFGAVPPTPTTYDGTGLSFLGWYTAKAGGTKVESSNVFTADKTLYAHWDGWYLDTEGTLFIAGEGPMDKYYTKSTETPDLTFYPGWDDLSIKKAVILEGVTQIGAASKISGADHMSGAFEFKHELTQVTIPDSVTSIGDYAFFGCYSLTSVTIPDSVTSIGYDAFAFSGLTSVTIPSGVTRIGDYAFLGCSSLTSVTISKGVTTIGAHAFNECTGLTSVTIPNSVTSIEWYAFTKCSGLTSITIPDGVTSIEREVFWGCSSLASVTIPSSVTSIEPRAFEDCAPNLAITYGGTVAQWNEIDRADVNIPSNVSVTCTDGTITT